MNEYMKLRGVCPRKMYEMRNSLFWNLWKVFFCITKEQLQNRSKKKSLSFIELALRY
jgi:hypothetical protein